MLTGTRDVVDLHERAGDMRPRQAAVKSGVANGQESGLGRPAEGTWWQRAMVVDRCLVNPGRNVVLSGG